MDTRKLIEDFIYQLTCKYPSLRIGYSYDDTCDEYDIWHTDQNLEFQNKYFKKHVSEMAREYLFKNNIYNFSFGYDHYKYKELKSITKFQIPFQHSNINLKINENILDTKCKYEFNYNIRTDNNNKKHINFKELNKSFANNYEKNIVNSKIDVDNIIYQDNKFEEAA